MKVLRILFFIALCLMGFATHAEEVTYTVRPGDKLWKIAFAHHTPVDTLAKTNSIANRDLIYPKQKLRINVSGRGVVEQSQSRATTIRSFTAVPSKNAVVVKALLKQMEVEDKTSTIETSLYTCTLRSSGSPHCMEKAVFDQREKAITASVAIPMNSLPPGVLEDASAETLIDIPNIKAGGEMSFTVLPDLFPLPPNDTRTQRRVSLRKFLRTYLGPPYDLARMEDVLLDARFPPLSRNHTVTEESLKTKK